MVRLTLDNHYGYNVEHCFEWDKIDGRKVTSKQSRSGQIQTKVVTGLGEEWESKCLSG